jgi:hypothetical protein
MEAVKLSVVTSVKLLECFILQITDDAVSAGNVM